MEIQSTTDRQKGGRHPKPHQESCWVYKYTYVQCTTKHNKKPLHSRPKGVHKYSPPPAVDTQNSLDTPKHLPPSFSAPRVISYAIRNLQ